MKLYTHKYSCLDDSSCNFVEHQLLVNREDALARMKKLAEELLEQAIAGDPDERSRNRINITDEGRIDHLHKNYVNDEENAIEWIELVEMDIDLFIHPNAGWSKQMILSDIAERLAGDDGHVMDDYVGIKKPDPKKLTDELAQQFANSYYELMEEAFDQEFPNMGDIACDQEDLLVALAKDIQED